MERKLENLAFEIGSPDFRLQFDFRSNLIVDQDNPILIQKAWRDHFAGKSCWQRGKDAGKAYLGVAHGEDAMTWNVFRSLQVEGPRGLEVVEAVLGLSTIESVLFWGCDADRHGENQQLLSILLRVIDGQLKGTMTEPDLVLVTEHEAAFVECKLKLSGNQSPWKAQGSGAEKRMDSYVETGFSELKEFRHWKEIYRINWENIYQIIRQYVYATLMGRVLQKQPIVVQVINAEPAGVLRKFYSPVQECPLNRGGMFRDLVTWQEISKSVKSSPLPCANKVASQITKALDAAEKKSEHGSGKLTSIYQSRPN